jgi:hypothetical protein
MTTGTVAHIVHTTPTAHLTRKYLMSAAGQAGSARLLAVLARYGEPFDATTITNWVQEAGWDGNKDLFDAMAFLAPKIGKGRRRLTEHTPDRRQTDHPPRLPLLVPRLVRRDRCPP